MGINWRLASNPINWAIVFLMLLIGAFFFQLVQDWLASFGATSEG
jgi:hypothetical protein